MRVVIWEDRRGYKHRSLIRDDDPDEAGPQGILQDPPDLHLVDWETVIKNMHNAFVEAGVYSWETMQNANTLQPTIFRSVKPEVIRLFRSLKNDGG
jgi:hypothetical protein